MAGDRAPGCQVSNVPLTILCRVLYGEKMAHLLSSLFTEAKCFSQGHRLQYHLDMIMSYRIQPHSSPSVGLLAIGLTSGFSDSGGGFVSRLHKVNET